MSQLRLRAVGFLLIILLGTPGPLLADWLITPFIGATFKGKTSFVDSELAAGLTKLNIGGNVTFLSDGVLGIEGDLGWTPGFFQRDDDAIDLVTDSSVTTLIGNVVLAVPLAVTKGSFRPYVSGGGGLMRVRIDNILPNFSGRTTLFGLNVGGGALGFLNDKIGLRWDLRYFWSLTDGKRELVFTTTERRLSFWRASMGVVIRR